MLHCGGLSPALGQGVARPAGPRPAAPCGAALPAAAPRRGAARRRAPMVASASAAAAPPVSPFSQVQSEAQLRGILEAGAKGGKVPPRLLAAFDELYANYKAAVLSSGLPGADEGFVARVMASVCERVLIELDPARGYTFPSHHTRILEPYNYYAFGQRYIRGLVDFKASALLHPERFAAVEAQLAAGDNVVLLANHQTEADPAVWALLTEAAFPRLATDVVYVAGDRVVTDPLCKPFSMGRNLFCVHSKKHMGGDPAAVAEKQATNRRTLKAMQRALGGGGQLLWIAPSGGRDRSEDAATGEKVPDAFDPAAVELMRALTAKAAPAAHLYPLAMYSHRIMPPPAAVETAIGEERLVYHAPVGLALGPELDVGGILAAAPEGDKDARQAALAAAAWEAVTEQYAALVAAITDPAARAATEGYSQPWLGHATPALDAGFS